MQALFAITFQRTKVENYCKAQQPLPLHRQVEAPRLLQLLLRLPRELLRLRRLHRLLPVGVTCITQPRTIFSMHGPTCLLVLQ